MEVLRLVGDSDVVCVNHVSKRYGDQAVLKDIHFSIRKGEIFGLLGPSGAGKTTLVKQLAGLEVPTDGENVIFQQRMPSLQIMKRIGYMGQSDALYGELSAKENLEFFAAIYGLKRKERLQRIPEVLKIVNLAGTEKKLVSSFSGGMKRRLSLAISLLHEPELLILDEPTVGIDPVLRKSIWQTFDRLKSNGTTIIVTTHVMDEAEKCDRLGLLRDGKLIAIGTPTELMADTSSQSIEEAFLVYGGAVHEN
ncbi:ABC transporter ATP-binding protein [Cytobacillus horneckiae]|uniref:ABC transporter ATP-binding protein n=1 Tax=Cytobacillus horneckiae TaxID=549687 RepID=A0A2N0ZDQ7_9BACI|nr:ABC transporter ATP-binding protein [Cytobacillus horneckiae]MEC1154523.1 ABC transporter ATP-binding protein [Cytobacillus horneckiae]MED2937858.1 ABC transporter ATP-binding protein [Cytobacillus horneckiae]NRG43403.1 ABC transporter ATP-binding protein [Bacillus sp. CRN 9]PKG27646.1 ABC transporter ATP-binding protein [Cytobacillus horneckiae]